MKKLVTIVCILFAIEAAACICTCIEKEFSIVDYNSAELIVKGKVLKVEYDKHLNEKIVTFKIYKSYKGNSNRVIKIRTPESGASCGLGINNQDKWLLFVYKDNNNLNVSLCAKNVRYNKRPNQSTEDYELKKKKMKNYIHKLKAFKKL